MRESGLLLDRLDYFGSFGNSFMKIVPVECVSGNVLGHVIEGSL